MNYEKISEKIKFQIETLFEKLRSGISAREDLATIHYKRIKADAEKRIKSIEQFKDDRYQNF